MVIEEMLKEFGAPDYIYMSEAAYWWFKYSLGLARYKPRMSGVKRNRRKKIRK